MPLTAIQYAEKAQKLCVLPDVYLRLKEILDDEKSTLEHISAILALEPALSSTLLKLANSAMFNFPREIASISKAITILGMKEVKNLINAYGVTSAFSQSHGASIDMDRFWEISVDCALLCKRLAQKKGIKNAESLFLSGLLHNVGELVILQTDLKKVQYCEKYNKEHTPWQLQQAVFGFSFADCSAELLTLWQLPETLIAPIRSYHNAYTEDLDERSSLLYVASRLAVLNSHPGMYDKKTFMGQHILKDLSITKEDLEEAINFCNAEGLGIMSALQLKN